VWRVDKSSADPRVEPTGVRGHSRVRGNSPSQQANLRHPEQQITAPHALSLGDPALITGNISEAGWRQWRAELAAVGGRSPLLHFTDSPNSRIELSTTHPGGLAQFITGRTTPLSSLIREDAALRVAKTAAGAIAAKGLEMQGARGIDSVHLGIGMAAWQGREESFLAPVLLRPLAIRRHGRDFDLKLRGAAFLNPSLAAALREQFGLDLDERAFVALTDDDGTFKPNPVIDRLRGLTLHIDGFTVSPRLVVSSFAEVASGLVADAAVLEHPVLDALSGNAAARRRIEDAVAPVEAVASDLRAPQTDGLLLDADSEQETVIAQVAAGRSVVVKTLPGTGGTQTIVNAIGTLVAQNRRVLVVGARRASLNSITDRLDAVGLPGMAVGVGTLRRDVIRSISRNEKAKQPQVGEVDDALLRLRSVLLAYRSALTRADPTLGVSILECVAELSRLALLPNAPTTTARLSRRSVERLAGERSSAAATMISAAQLGEFRYGPGDSPWYGAQFSSGEAALAAHAVARTLEERLPVLVGAGLQLVADTPMRPFKTLDELGIYLRLLIEIRGTLDRFLPAVFDRSITELIAATAPRRDFPDMTRGNRRRLKKLAQEYIRPGVRAADLHGALVGIQQQRVLWHRFVAEGATPTVPVGLAEMQRLYAEVAPDAAVLDEPLGLTSRETRLGGIPIPALLAKVSELAAESDVLHNLQERSALMSSLRHWELDPLLEDLARRHVAEDRIIAELELCWWKSTLQVMLADDHALLNADTAVLDRLEADFRLVDQAHAAGNAQLLAWQLAQNWSIGLVDWPDEAAALRRLLAREPVSALALQADAPHLARSVAPVWLASPYEIDRIADGVAFDAVILVDAGATTLAENTGAIRRAKQVIAFGDPVTQTPAPFSIAVTEPGDAATAATAAATTAAATGEPETAAALPHAHENSALARLATLLPTLTLTRSYRPGGEDLAELVNRRFYGGRIQSLPWAGSFLGHGSLALEYVPGGHGMPDPVSGAVESPDAELERVVDLVLNHAARKPHESLMVITASAHHAVRVMQAVLAAAVTRPDVTDFVTRDSSEPFAVLTIEQAVAQSRDRVIFSIGYGRTPHGRVLSDFGALGEPGGDRLLAVAMTRSRRSMVIVTSFEPADLDDGRMRHGAAALAEILAEVGARSAMEPVPDDSAPMLVDLAQRLQSPGLRSQGLTVSLGHRGKLGLVVARGGMCLAIETDNELNGSSLRESLRLRPELLRRMGWHYLRVHAFELFSDPDAVAIRIATVLGVDAAGAAAAAAAAAGQPTQPIDLASVPGGSAPISPARG